jgi:Domain of unknown function (DUF4129)
MSVKDPQSEVVWSVTIAVMVGCFAISLLPFLEALQPKWSAAYLPLFCAVAALGGYFSHRAGNDGESGGWRRLQARAVQVLALLVGLQLYANLAGSSVGGNFSSFHSQALWYAPGLILAWLIGKGMAADLSRLGEPPLHDARYVAPERRLASGVWSGGTAMFAVSGLTLSHVAVAGNIPRASGSASVLNGLAYFVCGMLMLGRVRYAVKLSSWEDRHISVAPQLGRRWQYYSAAVLALLLLGTLALSGRTFGVEKAPRAIASQVQSLFASPPAQPHNSAFLRQGPTKWQVYQYMPAYPYSAGPGWVTQRHRPPRCCILSGFIVLHTGRPPEGHKATGGWPLPAMPGFVKGLFVVLVIVTLLYLLYALLGLVRRRRGSPLWARSVALMAAGKLPQLFRALALAWIRLIQGLLTRLGVSGFGDVSFRYHANAGNNRFRRLVRPGRLGPREQIVYYYLSALRRAERHGLRRRVSQTPIEFQNEVGWQLPEVSGDLGILTDAFLEARYSRHPIDAVRVSLVRQSWIRVRKALQRAP